MVMLIYFRGKAGVCLLHMDSQVSKLKGSTNKVNKNWFGRPCNSSDFFTLGKCEFVYQL